MSPRVLTIPTGARLVDEADAARLRGALDWARRAYRPTAGYLLDAPVTRRTPAPKLPMGAPRG